MIRTIEADLLDATEPVIAHQCNCTTRGEAAGVARSIFAKYPFADTYRDRRKMSEPGTYSAHWEDDSPVILNLYAQRYPGQANEMLDTQENRKLWFYTALTSFVWEMGAKEIALPYLIGCGMAGGNWDDYKTLLKEISEETKVDFTLYKLV